MHEGERRANAEAPLEARPDVDAHHHRGEDQRQDGALAQRLADPRADCLDAQHLESVLAEARGQGVGYPDGDSLLLGRGQRQPDQKLAVPSAQFLDVDPGQIGARQRPAHVRRRRGLREAHVHQRTAGEIDSQVGAAGTPSTASRAAISSPEPIVVTRRYLMKSKVVPWGMNSIIRCSPSSAVHATAGSHRRAGSRRRR